MSLRRMSLWRCVVGEREDGRRQAPPRRSDGLEGAHQPTRVQDAHLLGKCTPPHTHSSMRSLGDIRLLSDDFSFTCFSQTKSGLEVRQHSDRLGKFCEWVADQRMTVAVETSIGYFKKGIIKVDNHQLFQWWREFSCFLFSFHFSFLAVLPTQRCV
jgi:hypothetical protein